MLVKTVKIKDGDGFRIINEKNFQNGKHELCDGETLSTGPVSVNVSVGITPELQQTLDEAKAECKKVAAENDKLQTDLTNVVSERDALSRQVAEQLSSIDSLNKTITGLDAKLKKQTAAEEKTAKSTDQPKE
ncbi:MAG: hypothetical protein KAZ18_00195 [Acinetobacter sp.]|nr:hypothetical protein [Acinetobacter sp.]